MLRPTCLINCTDELPDTPLPDTVHRYLKVPVTDTAVTDLRPHMDMVADLIHQVITECYRPTDNSRLHNILHTYDATSAITQNLLLRRECWTVR